MKKFLIKIKVLKMLNYSARTWKELSSMFPQDKLLFALQELKEDGYIRDNSLDYLIGDEFCRTHRHSLIRFIEKPLSAFICLISAIIGIIAWIQSLI